MYVNLHVLSFKFATKVKMEGRAAGFVAGKLMRGGGFGLFINLLVGIVGGVLGGWVFSLFGIAATGIMGSLVTSIVGAIFLLWIVSLLKRSDIS